MVSTSDIRCWQALEVAVQELLEVIDLVCCFCGHKLTDDIVKVDLVRADRKLGAYLAHSGCEADHHNPNYKGQGTGVKYYLRPAIKHLNVVTVAKGHKGDSG